MLNLRKLMKAQKKLDDRIVKEKGLEGKCLLDKKILALQVELGELANEWRGFKFWSEDRKPRYEIIDVYVHGYGGPGQNTRASIEEIQKQPLLEEYVDCLHFIMSIGNDLEIEQWDYGYDFSDDLIELNSTTEQLIFVISKASDLFFEIVYKNGLKGDEMVNEFELAFRVWHNYKMLIGSFLSLGKMLGFTWKQIEQAYFEKNKVNHERQENNY